MRILAKFAIVVLIVLSACQVSTPVTDTKLLDEEISNIKIPEGAAVATFAGGCFWCMEPPFEKLDGVYAAVSGYAGGKVKNPNYKLVSSGVTGYVEAVQVYYDPKKISYFTLLDVFWKTFDPTDEEGSFVDRGFQYTSAVFYRTNKELALTLKSIEKIQPVFVKKIVTRVTPFTNFYPAEEYHQDYYKNKPFRYKIYRSNSGRDDFLDAVWEDRKLDYSEYVKPSDEQLKAILSELQFFVTQEEGTEKPYKNEFYDSKEEGIYVDILSGEALFSSTDKYDSKTGWPSFSKPIDAANIVLKDDKKFLTTRTEVRSRYGDNHLGHVFTDGPEDTGLRYCINSAALRFVSKDEMQAQGYGAYLYLFAK